MYTSYSLDENHKLEMLSSKIKGLLCWQLYSHSSSLSDSHAVASAIVLLEASFFSNLTEKNLSSFKLYSLPKLKGGQELADPSLGERKHVLFIYLF